MKSEKRTIPIININPKLPLEDLYIDQNKENRDQNIQSQTNSMKGLNQYDHESTPNSQIAKKMKDIKMPTNICTGLEKPQLI